MNDSTTLNVDGDVDRPLRLTFADLAELDEPYQVRDVSRLDPKRHGDAVKLEAVLRRAQPRATARYITLHSSRDDFHASIPLPAVRDRAILIYRLDGKPLPISAGGPVRFFIPDFASCQTAEIDECANVKFIDHIELTPTRGYDNRPADESQHAALHDRQSPS